MEAPVLQALLPSQVTAGSIALRMRVTDASPVLYVAFYWRRAGAPDFEPVTLDSIAPRVFGTTFEADRDVEFWAEAYDTLGNGPGLLGSASAPIVLRVVPPESRPRPVEPSPPVEPERPPPVPETTKKPLQRPTPARPPPRPVPAPPKEPEVPLPPPMTLPLVLRVRTAMPSAPQRLQLSAGLGFESGSDFLLPGATMLGGGGELRATYAPTWFSEIGLSTSLRGASLSTSSTRSPAVATSLGDLALHARAVTPLVFRMRAGLSLDVDLHAPNWAVGALAASTTALASVSFVQGLLRTHVHAGYRWDNSENLQPGRWNDLWTFGQGLSRFDAIKLGAAVEAEVGLFVPFLEYTLDLPVDRRAFSSCDLAECASRTLFPATAAQVPQRVGVGGRVEILGEWAIVFGGEFSLTPAGSGLSDATVRSTPAREGLAPPPPFAFRLGVVGQFGATGRAPDALERTPWKPVEQADVLEQLEKDRKAVGAPAPIPERPAAEQPLLRDESDRDKDREREREMELERERERRERERARDPESRATDDAAPVFVPTTAIRADDPDEPAAPTPAQPAPATPAAAPAPTPAAPEGEAPPKPADADAAVPTDSPVTTERPERSPP